MKKCKMMLKMKLRIIRGYVSGEAEKKGFEGPGGDSKVIVLLIIISWEMGSEVFIVS